jgi:hypothetical protein
LQKRHGCRDSSDVAGYASPLRGSLGHGIPYILLIFAVFFDCAQTIANKMAEVAGFIGCWHLEQVSGFCRT